MTDLATPAAELAQADARATYDAFTEEWLKNRRFSENTRDGYRRDVKQWLDWCEDNDLDPRAALFTDVNAWGRELESSDDGSKALSAATVHRKMCAVSSWYGFLVKLGAMPANPAAVADRPHVDSDYSPTVSFTHDEARGMLEAAAAGGDPIGEVGPLLAAWMVGMGTRATETTLIDLSHLGYDRGHRVVQMVHTKGGRRKRRTIPPTLNDLLGRYLEYRAGQAGCTVEELAGALFVDAKGRPLDRHALFRFVRRLARAAGLPNADKITPHSFRHAWNAIARSRGADLEHRQDAMGHRDPRTTRRYDRTGSALENDPSMLVAAAVARREEQPPDFEPKPGEVDYWPREVS
jgi:integrase/recombinase XerD